jgi:hypothetical protein
MNARQLSMRVPALTAGLALIAGVVAAVAAAAAPVNASPPTVSGTARQGATLTAENGTWQNSPTSFQYQWRRCDAAGGSCDNVTNATGKTYRLTGGDVGRTLRVRVTAVNADGSASADSAPTAAVTGQGAQPRNTERPSIDGTARVGQTLTANAGSWSGNPDSFAFQWQRCDADGSNCGAIATATGRAYLVRTADLGFRLRVQVTARNARGTATSTSGVTAIVAPAARIRNQRPTLRILSVRFLGARVYARFRICDDSLKNLSVPQTDSRPGRLSYTRRFSTLTPPRPCGVYTRSWVPAPRFRGPGMYVVTLRAVDKSGFRSLPARRAFQR